MADEQSKEAIIASAIVRLFEAFGIHEISVSLIKQIAYRMGSKSDSSAVDKLKVAFENQRIILKETKSYYDAIDTKQFEFDRKKVDSGTVMPPENFFFNTHHFSSEIPAVLSEVNKDLFTVVAFLQPRLFDTVDGIDIRSEAGQFSLRNTILKYLEECDKGKAKGGFNIDDHATRYFQNICLAAKNNILNDNQSIEKDNLRKYKRYLKEQEVVSYFLTLVKPGELKDAVVLFETPFIAEKILEFIMRKGFKYEEAIYIYNRQFGCSYIPFTDEVAIICVKCLKVYRNKSIKPTEKCICGESLFRKCGRTGCGEYVPRYIDVCPRCGSRESDSVQFMNIIASAKSLLSKGYIEQAETYLVAAQALDPDRKSDINGIQDKIDKAKKDRGNIISEIDDLIVQRAFYAAEKKLIEAKKKLSPESLNSIEQRIVNAQNNADKQFVAAGNTTDELQKVLAICIDHPGALERIEKIPPKPPTRLTVKENNKNQIRLSWNASPDIGVKYRLIRKEESPPKTVYDGDDDFDVTTDKLFADDTSPIPGKTYYAVFTERGSITSIDSAVGSLEFFPDVLAPSLRQLKDRVEIKYQIPMGASGVHIAREMNGKTTTIFQGQETVVVERPVPDQCSYIITTLFKSGKSKGKVLPFTASTLPKEIKPQIKTERNRVCVSWDDTKQKEYTVKILEVTQADFSLSEGEFYQNNELAEKARELVNISCDKLSVTFDVTPNIIYRLLILIGGPNGYLCCGMFPICAVVYPKIRRKWQRVDDRGNHFFVFEERLPEDVCGFSYSIQKKTTPEPVKFTSGDMNDSSGDNGPMIYIRNTDHAYVGRWYIFVKFKLKNGKETPLFCSDVHFQQNIKVHAKLKCKGTKLKAELRFFLNVYDYEGYPVLSSLTLSVGNVRIPFAGIPVSPEKTNYTSIEELQLPAPINDLSKLKLILEDQTLYDDFKLTTID